MLNKPGNKSDTIHLRIEPHSKDLIDRAAHLMGKTRSAFVLEAAAATAERMLLDQTLFQLSAEDFQAFNEAISKSPAQNKKLRKLLAQKAPWE